MIGRRIANGTASIVAGPSHQISLFARLSWMNTSKKSSSVKCYEEGEGAFCYVGVEFSDERSGREKKGRKKQL